MDKRVPNAIARARNSRGLTQEALAEAAGYSVDSIRVWEAGTRVATNEALQKLEGVLDVPWLMVVYLREELGALTSLLPDFRVGMPLPQAAAKYVTCVLDLVDNRIDRKLLRMVADGKIDEVEQPVFREILDLAEATNSAYYEMKFARDA